MIGLTKIFLGLIVGGAGFLRMAEEPLQGCCALLLAGFLVMTGFDERRVLKARASEQETR